MMFDATTPPRAGRPVLAPTEYAITLASRAPKRPGGAREHGSLSPTVPTAAGCTHEEASCRPPPVPRKRTITGWPLTPSPPDPPSGRCRGDSAPDGLLGATTIEGVLAHHLLSVVFQPIVNLRTGSLFAYEALVRCPSPAFAEPESLIAAAVDRGLIGELGREIRRLAVERCPHWPLFVNVHPGEFEDRWLVRTDDPIFSHELPVYLEITEQASLDRYPLHRGMLSELRGRGLRVAVDDLGSGYSNLKYLADLSPDFVKLDRNLVADLAAQRRVRHLVGAVVALCDRLGASCIAEGIETYADLRAAREAGVQYGQGYLLARPASPPPSLGRWVREAR